MTQLNVEKKICIVAKFEYEAGRPPPPCSNPDSPAYSDPGDPETIELEEVFVQVLSNTDEVEDEIETTWEKVEALLGPGILDTFESACRDEALYQAQQEMERDEAMREDYEERRAHRLRRYRGEY